MIACVRLSCFAATLEAAQLSRPLLIVRTVHGRARTLAVNPQAIRQGVSLGMPLSRAQALCPDALIRPAAPDRWRRQLDERMGQLSHYSQYVDAAPDVAQTALIYLDLGKLRPAEGLALAAEMRERMMAAGFVTSVGLASGKFTAGLAASSTATVHLVPPGGESGFLAPLPVEHLPLERETARRLALLGLQVIGQLATLPGGALAAQFGAEGARLARLAQGKDNRRVARYLPDPREEEWCGFEPAVEDRQIIERVLTTMTSRLSHRLNQQGWTCGELTLTLRFEDGGSVESVRRLREPLNSAQALSRLGQMLLERLTLNRPVSAVACLLGRLAPVQPRQMSLFGDEDDEELRLRLIDATARYGDDRLYGVTLIPPLYPLPELAFRLERVAVA